MTQTTDYRLKFAAAYRKGLREYIKEFFRNMPFTEAWDLTAADREKCLLISTESRIRRMCVETSKFNNLYNL